MLPHVSRSTYLEQLDRRLAHFHYLSPQDWTSICEANGLVVDVCHGYLNTAETRRWETLSRMTGGLLYALGGGRARPIEIQRKLGARALQNALALPRPAARALAHGLALGIHDPEGDHRWVPAEQASCFLVMGRRRGADA